MNKNKKIAMAVVATVMAGAMVVPLAACNNEEDLGPVVDLGTPWTVLKENGDLDYSVYQRENPVTLNIAIGHNSADTSTAFPSGTPYTLPDGNTYVGGSMKPAWVQMGKDLNITWKDVYNGFKTSDNLNNIVAGQGLATYDNTDMFTTDLSKAIDKVNAGTRILNLADYLDYMPNFKNYLESNPIVYLSLLQDGMSTTDGSNKKLYVAPYFDGNDDIERYCIIRQDWADIILNENKTLGDGEAFSANCAATTSVEAFMTGKEYIPVDITSPTPDSDGNYTGVSKVYKNYKNVATKIKTSGSDLYDAYHDIVGASGADYNGEGNIVSIMNAAIAATNGSVTGDKLAKLFRAYVDACYTDDVAGNTSHYAANSRSNLFNGYDAAWDVDDLVAMLRCVMTNQYTLLTSDSGLVGEQQVGGQKKEYYRELRKIYGIAPRSGQNNRTPDMVRLACQLYGARGADSRYEYTYIDNDGNLQDARNDESFYTALENFNKLRKEGLVANYEGFSNFKDDGGYIADKGIVTDQKTGVKSTDNSETFMMYDYCQTQTVNGFYTQGVTGKDVPRGYNFAPVLTPVSKWDVNGKDGIEDNEYFRFTESWRSTKTSGLALNGLLAYNKDKLIAALQFVDYLYSEDGQIVSTFGPMAENKDGKGGFWYNEVQSDPKETENADKSVTKNYFSYKGVKYKADELYKGRMTPTITDVFYKSFMDKDEATHSTVSGVALNFTNYARYMIGSTLPIGVKDQSFENQLTSTMGKNGAAKVGAALANKTESGYTVVRGMTLSVNESDWWYTCVPTGLPISSTNVSRLNNSNMNDLKYMSGESKKDDNFFSIFNHIILNGVKAPDDPEKKNSYNEQGVTYTLTGMEALVTEMSTNKNAQLRENILATGWTTAKNYWTYLKPTD